MTLLLLLASYLHLFPIGTHGASFLHQHHQQRQLQRSIESKTTQEHRWFENSVAFVVSSSCSPTKLRDVIKSEELDFDFDVGKGGVDLALNSAIKISGNVKHKPGKATPKIKDLMRYGKVEPIDESDAREALSKIGGTIICTGQGKEFFKDPGESTESVVTLAPNDAVRDALTVAASASSAAKITVNFFGGDDLQVLEVLDSLEHLVLSLDVNTKAEINFNSISHSSSPLETTTVTVVAFDKTEQDPGDDKPKGVEKALASGEIYVSDGKWRTVLDEDINTAIE